MSIEADDIESQLDGEGIEDDDNTADQTHASIDVLTMGDSITSGITLDRDLVTKEALEEMTPIMGETFGSSSDYHPDEAYTKVTSDKEIMFRERFAPMNDSNASIDIATLTSGPNQNMPRGGPEKRQRSVTFALDELEDEDEDDQEEAGEQAMSYLEDLVYNEHSELPLHATPSLQQPLSTATPYADLDLLEEIPALLEEVPPLLEEVLAPPMLEKKASDQYRRRKHRYSSQSVVVKGGSLCSSLDTPNTHHSLKSETFSSKSILGNKGSSSTSSSIMTDSTKEASNKLAGMKESIAPAISLEKYLPQTLSAGRSNKSMPASFQGDSVASIRSKVSFAATYVMEALESSPNPRVVTRQRRPMAHDDAPIFDQPMVPTRSAPMTQDPFQVAGPTEMETWTPIVNENVAPTKRSKKKGKKVKTKKKLKEPKVDKVSGGTVATRRRNLKLDVMKRLAEEEVIVEAPIISMEYNTMARHTSHEHGRPLKSKTDHQNSPRPKRALAPGAAQSAQQPTDTGHQNPQKSTFDLDAEMGLPRGNNFHLPREAQRVLTGYSSFTSSDTTDDGIQLLRASEIEREHQRFESNFAVSIYDEQPKEDRDSDALVAYAVEIPALGGQESLETDDVPINYGDSSSDHIFKTKSTRNRKRCYLVVVFAVVVAAAMATAGYIFKTRKSHSKTPPLSTANATSSPTTGPTMSTYGLKALILTYLPDTARSLEKDTPQHDAFTWLESATNDAYKGDSRRMLQRYALAVFFYSTGGPQWLKRSGWTTSDDECTWEFTSTTYPCNTDGNIIWIDMRQNSLIGELPVEVSMLLPFIRGIDLSGNQLAEAFPTHLQSLVGLEYYFVEANHVTGILPSEIGLLTNIQYLSLSQNRLSGTIPSVIGRLTNLRYLSLATNSLTGTLPTEVGLLRNIETVDLERNELRGTIPSQFHLLPGLNDLALSINFFTGRIPSEFGNLIGLTSLTMDLNDLIGPVPSELGRLTTLRTLWLQQNSLTGTIPPEIGSIGSLVWLDMSDNLLQGSLPEEIGDLTNLEVVKLNENDLEQAIPASFGKCKRLAHLMLYGNRLNGTIPSGFGDLFLDILDLRDNNLTGSLPADLVDGVAADAFLDVSGNLLTGTVPYLICEKLAIGNGELKVDCGELLCDASCCPSCAFQVAAFDVFGG